MILDIAIDGLRMSVNNRSTDWSYMQQSNPVHKFIRIEYISSVQLIRTIRHSNSNVTLTVVLRQFRLNNKVCGIKMSLAICAKQQRNILKKLCESVNHRNQYRYLTTKCSSSQLKCNSTSVLLLRRCHSSNAHFNLADQNDAQDKNKRFDFHQEWPSDVKNELLQDMILIEDFVTEPEEEKLCEEIQKAMRRMRYQYDHWDNAIHGFREMEKLDWRPENEQVIQRVRNKAFVANVLPHVHILDLAADGIIKPHVDSSRYCGSTIAGVSLLTDCIMRLKRVDEEKYKQKPIGEDDPVSTEDVKRDENRTSETNEGNEFDYFVDVLLKRRSLYIMKHSARYKFSHEVLASKSTFLGKEIVKDKRISIICRNQP